MLPDYPHTTRWLSDEERAFAAWRLLADVNEDDERHSTSIWAGVKLVLRDYRLYLFVLLQHISLLSQTFQYFFPSIVGTLGYTPIITLWLTAPVWVSEAACLVYSAGRCADSDRRAVCDLFGLCVRDVVIREDRRPLVARHHPHAHRSSRECHCNRDDVARGSFLCHVPHANGRCFGL